MEDDATLLRNYSEQRSEPAFSELVRRHLNLVYSVALRQVGGDVHLAEDVTQGVFTELARKAALIAQHPAVNAWLYRTTWYQAIKAVRGRQRRQKREQEAQLMREFGTVSGEERDIRPILDQVMVELDARDRAAVMLRFIEGHPFSEVGRRLHLSEDTARKRVERSLDKLQALLARRGITSTAVALALSVSQQAGVAAPAGLALMTSKVALAGAASSGIGASLSLGFQLFMNTTNKITIATTVLALGLGGWWHQRRVSELETSVANLAKQAKRYAEQGQTYRQQRDEARTQVLPRSTATELAAAASTGGDASIESPEWLKITQLQAYLAQNPDKAIPELQLLQDADWTKVAREAPTPLDTDEKFRRALKNLRLAAKLRLAPLLKQALQDFVNANGHQAPAQMAQLFPYLDAAATPAMLARYDLTEDAVGPNRARGIGPRQYLIGDRNLMADDLYEFGISIGVEGWSFGAIHKPDSFEGKMQIAVKKWLDANPGKERPADLREILPYVDPTVDPVRLEEYLKKKR